MKLAYFRLAPVRKHEPITVKIFSYQLHNSTKNISLRMTLSMQFKSRPR